MQESASLLQTRRELKFAHLTQEGVWVRSPLFDTCFLLLPPFVIVFAILFLPALRYEMKSAALWTWIPLALLLDYGHQYSALFRTYWDHSEIRQRRILYTLVPLGAFVCCLMLYQIGEVAMWRAIIYLAIFHFVRQQYGFMVLYARKELSRAPFSRFIDRIAIYAATLYPVLYEHTHLPRDYNWGGFDVLIPLRMGGLYEYLFPLYVSIVSIYVLKEAYFLFFKGNLNVQKNAVFWGTLLAWYVGLVHYNSIIIFYACTQFCHSIPYIALVWSYGNRKWHGGLTSSRGLLPKFLMPSTVLLFIGAIGLLGSIEMGLWTLLDPVEDSVNLFYWVPQHWVGLVEPYFTIVIPLLAVPQITHYVLDGFIWKIKKGDRRWMDVLWNKRFSA